MNPASTKILYAQSSDLRARSFLEYKRDMKKKGIAELEFLPYLEILLRERYSDRSIEVSKSGGDALLWFGRTGKQVTRYPDYEAVLPNGERQLYEFQMAEDSNLDQFDFKVSKVGRKHRGVRHPYLDREFFYILEDRREYAFFTPSWILENSEYGFVRAWRVSAYRVPKQRFLKLFRTGGEYLGDVIDVVKDKRFLLEFGQEFMVKEARKFAKKFQRVVDDAKLAKIVPRTLKGFYQVCFLLDRIGREPSFPGIWLVYLASLYRDDMTRLEFARFMYALDFVYFKCLELRENEIAICSDTLERATGYVRSGAGGRDGAFAPGPRESTVEATRSMVFATSLLEDIIQDSIVEYGVHLEPVSRIFQTIPDPGATAAYIRGVSS